jgi:putative transposase
MPDDFSSEGSPRRLRRLSRVWVEDPIYFVTACVAGRRAFLADEATHGILREVWGTGCGLNGWQVGRYVIMPDHVHLFCAPNPDAASLSTFVGGWKEWSSKFFRRRLGLKDFQWQPNFFDHVLRSEESYSEKWQYVRDNPVRAGLVGDADEWPYGGHMHFS